MNKEEILLALENFGLSSNESKVYIASLELGLSKVSEISKKAKILRETTYGVINSLLDKGLMSYVLKSGIKYFEAVGSTKLIYILKEKERMINNISQDLNLLSKMTITKPSVELLEGKEGLKTIQELLLSSKKFLVIASNKHLKKILKSYFPNFVKRRIKLKIKVKLLSDEKPMGEELLQYKPLPKNFNIKTATYLFDDKIAIISLNQQEPVGIIIKNKDIFNTQKNMFDLLWSLIDKQ